jgi:hypothetical protein
MDSENEIMLKGLTNFDIDFSPEACLTMTRGFHDDMPRKL